MGRLMTDAREIIARAICGEGWAFFPIAHRKWVIMANRVIAALTAAGYRILAPGEVERVARAISKVASGSEANWKDYCEEAHAAIRSLEVSNG